MALGSGQQKRLHGGGENGEVAIHLARVDPQVFLLAAFAFA